MAEAEDEPVEAEVIKPPPEAATRAKEVAPARTFFHPLSGLVILGIDWLAFGTEIPADAFLSPVVGIPLMSIAAFLATYSAVSAIQLRHGDEKGPARLKALLGALAAGVPFPITGTIVGTAILLVSGLPTGKRHR